MIGVNITRGHAETLDRADAEGRYLEIQIGSFFFMFYIGRRQ